MKRDHYVFVCGTLRKGERNHHLLEEAELIAEHCWTYGEMFDSGCGYPAIKPSNTQKIYGEIYAINSEELKNLDLLEDYVEGGKDNLYDRVKQIIYTDIGEIEAFIYIASNEKILITMITSGDWRTYRLKKG